MLMTSLEWTELEEDLSHSGFSVIAQVLPKIFRQHEAL